MWLRPVTRKHLPVSEEWNADLLAEELETQVFYDCTVNFCCSINENDLSIPCDERALAVQLAGLAALGGAIFYFHRKRTPKQ
ncbi:MAG: hypothetical protein AB2385_11005 [Symbiobacterium sp.]